LLYCPDLVSGASLNPFHRLGRINQLKIGIPKTARR
jgi:hypothetical protein